MCICRTEDENLEFGSHQLVVADEAFKGAMLQAADVAVHVLPGHFRADHVPLVGHELVLGREDLHAVRAVEALVNLFRLHDGDAVVKKPG